MMKIREMTFDDIAAVAEIERDNSLTPWDETGLFTYLIRDDTLFLVAESEAPQQEILGYAGLLMVPYEADITNITVKESARRRGIGESLLKELFSLSGQHGVSVIHLEVRASAEAAKQLYQKLGFKKDGIRKNYYTGPAEDAVTMTLTLAEPAAGILQ